MIYLQTEAVMEDLNNPHPIKIVRVINFITRNGKTVPCVLVERQFGAVIESTIIPIKKFNNCIKYINLIGLDTFCMSYTADEVNKQLGKLCLNKDVLTLVDNFGFCDLNGTKAFVHAGGAITNSFSPALPLTSSYRNEICNLMSLSTKDKPQILVSSFLQILKVSDSKPEIGSVLMALITREALLHFEPSCVSVFFVNNLFRHTPSLYKFYGITCSNEEINYDCCTYNPEIYLVKQSKNTNTNCSQDLYIEVNKKDIDINVLSEDYMDESEECFSKVMNLFIQYIINNYDYINSQVSSKLKDDHRSYPSKVVADLMLGIDIFLDFCVAGKYLKKQKAKAIHDSQYEIIEPLVESYFIHSDRGLVELHDITNINR